MRRSIGYGLCCLLFALAVSAPAAAGAGDDIPFPAKEFDPRLPWLNVQRPLTLDDLKGKVVILDFWTYGCINCIHVLEDLRRLEHKFGNRLAVIGVHTPKFDNERNLDTLRSILLRYRIEHPVVNDVNARLGRYYGMRAWPTQIVIDPTGYVLGEVLGEGNYDVLEGAVERLLAKHAKAIDTRPLPLQPERIGDALLAAPGKIAVANGRVAIADTLHNRVVIADRDGRIETVYGGTEGGFRDGDAAAARFLSPQGLAFSDGGLYVADTGNHAIRHIDLRKRSVATVAGGGEDEIRRNGDYDALRIRLRSPWALALRDDTLYVAMAGTHQIWRLNLATQRIADYAGSGREGLRDGGLAEARFSQPSGLSLSGNQLYVADAEDSAVRRIDLDKGTVETLVGTGLFDFGDRDGTFGGALLQHVLGVADAGDSRLLIADTYNHKVKQLDLKRRRVETLVGTGAPGRGDGDSAAYALNEPGGLALLDRRLLIADTNNNRIVQYDLDTGTAGEWVLKP